MVTRHRQSSLLQLFVLLCLSLSFSPLQAANDRGFFWRVDAEDADSSTGAVYLMGSIHFADKSFYPLREEIEQAFDNSDVLVVELDIDEADHLIYDQMLTTHGVFKDGRTIRDVVSDETWQVLRERLQQLNVSYDAIKYYKPGMLVLTLASLQVMSMGFDPELGIDAHFLAKAKHVAGTGRRPDRYETPQDTTLDRHQPARYRSGQGRLLDSSLDRPLKKIIELETIEQQMKLFLDMPDGDLLLKESLYTFEESELLMADMVRYWKAGDVQRISRLLFEDALTDYPAFSSIYERLFYERNRQMTAKIEQMLDTDEVCFIVVGSGHLVGDKGIVKLLTERGFRVKRL